MPTIFTGGPSKITITGLGGPRVPFGLLAVIGGAVWVVYRYGRSIGQAVTITAAITFGVLLVAVTVASVLLARRIVREVRVIRQAPGPAPAPSSIQHAPARAIPAPARQAIPVRGIIITPGQVMPAPASTRTRKAS